MDETRYYKEPTRDEIALSAFLAWERAGRPQGGDLHYWLEAERNLRVQRQKQAEAAAAQAAKPWPPQSRSARTKSAKEIIASPGQPSLITTAARTTALQVKTTKTSGSTRTSRTSLKAAR